MNPNAVVVRHRKKNKKIRWILIIILIVFLVIFFNRKPKQQALISPIATDNHQSWEYVDSFDFYDVGIARLVNSELKDQKGEFAIVVESLDPDTKIRFYQNENVVMPAASLYKLILLATAYEQIEQGKLTKGTQLTATEAHLIDVLGSKEFGYEDLDEDSITYSVSQLMTRISAISDNYAAIMLAEKVGWDNVRVEAKKIGLNSTTISSPITTTASDIALYFRKLYLKQIVSRQSSDEIIELLANSRINNRIPKKLPESLKIAHKTGELPLVRNDAGIVFLEKNSYIIVLLSRDLEGEDSGVETLANISGDVYQYFASVVK